MNAGDPAIAHEWNPIEDLPDNWQVLCRDDLHAVHRQWIQDRELIRDEAKLKRFQQELATEWAIETGMIERLYRVDRGITVQIVHAGMEALGRFHARGQLSTDGRALINDQREALEMVMDFVGGQRNLTDSYLKQLHQRLTLSQEYSDAEDQFGNPIQVTLQRGTWKTQSNNPKRPDGSIHEYCPVDFVQDEIDQLLNWRREHEQMQVCPEVEAAWLHHRFSQIHPFQDGNGRMARAITSAVFLRADFLVLVVRDEDHRNLYLDALEYADRGELKPLVDLFADIQIADLQRAIAAVRDVRGETIVKVTETIAERARRRKEEAQRQAAGVMEDLVRIVNVRLEEASGELRRAFDSVGVSVQADVRADDQDRRDWWHWQIVEAAKTHGYFAELSRPRRWVSMRLALPDLEDRDTRLVFSLHAIGRSADLHAVTAFLTTPSSASEGYQAGRWDLDVIPEHAFKFRTETSSLTAVEPKFREWLEETLETSLAVWGDRL